MNHTMNHNLYTNNSNNTHTSRFDLSIAQLEQWPVKAIRTRRNGSTGLRRDIQRILKRVDRVSSGVFQAAKSILARVDNILDKIQLRPSFHSEQEYSSQEYSNEAYTNESYTISTPRNYRDLYQFTLSGDFSSPQFEQFSLEPLRIDNITPKTAHLNSIAEPSKVKTNTSQASVALRPSKLAKTHHSKRRPASLHPMQQVVESNLLKDGLIATIWIGLVPSVMFLGTMAGF